MKKLLIAAVAAAAGFLAVPALAAMDKPMDATMLCRPAMPNEKPMAMMGTKGMVCKSMAPMMTDGHMGPKVAGMTAQQTDAAWRAWIQQSMLIQSNTGTTGGNG